MRLSFGIAVFCWLTQVAYGGVTPTAPADNLVTNFSFEQKFTNNWFGLWEIDPTIGDKGTLVQTFKPIHSGIYALKLTPNSKNTVQPGYLNYGIAQSLPVDKYRGKPLQFQGWLGSTGGATDLLGVVAVPVDGNAVVRFIRVESSPSSTAVDKLALYRDVFDVPDVPLKYLFVICSVEGTAGRGYFDDVVVSNSLSSSWSMGQPDPGLPLAAKVSVDYGSRLRDIPASLWGMNIEYPYSAYGLYDPTIGTLDNHLLTLSSDLGATSWRFPGGLFANFYHWRDGVGPPSQRPAGLILPQTGYTDNYFGTDEALQFADSTNADLFVTVNAHTGTPAEAADWVSYVNADGKHHIANWEIGNELYFYQNAQDTSGPVWTAETYASAFRDFASAMKAADPSIKLAADIEYNLTLNGCGVVSVNGCWADVVLNRASDQIDLIALHNGLAPLMLGYDAGWDARTVYAGMLAAPLQVKSLLNNLSRKVDALGGANSARIKFAMVEWGPLFQANPQFRFVDHVKTIGSALLTAGMLKTIIEEPRMEIAHAFTLVEPQTQGLVGPRSGVYTPTASYYAFQLFTKHFGNHLVHSETLSPVYDSKSIGLVPATPNVPYLDSISSTDDQGNLYVIATNKHFDRDMSVSFVLRGFTATAVNTWTLNGTALDANTGTGPSPSDNYVPQTQVQPDGRFYNGGPGEVTVTSAPLAVSGSCFTVQLPAHSVTSLVIQGLPLGSATETMGCDAPAGQ